jgi:hypothetical protein
VVGMNTRPEVLTEVGISEDCTKRVTPGFSPFHFFPFPVEVFVPGTSRPVQTHFVLLAIMSIVPLSATREEKKTLLSQTLTDFRRRLIELVYKHSDLFDPQGGGGYVHHLNSALRQAQLMTEGIDLYVFQKEKNEKNIPPCLHGEHQYDRKPILEAGNRNTNSRSKQEPTQSQTKAQNHGKLWGYGH